jgi:hypothetical protein
MPGKPIKFTLSQDAAAYLQWLAKNIVPEETPDLVARHLVMKQIEKMRRAHHRKEEPPFSELPPAEEERK